MISSTGICQQSLWFEISVSTYKIHIPCTKYWIQQEIHAIKHITRFFGFAAKYILIS